LAFPESSLSVQRYPATLPVHGGLAVGLLGGVYRYVFLITVIQFGLLCSSFGNAFAALALPKALPFFIL